MSLDAAASPKEMMKPSQSQKTLGTINVDTVPGFGGSTTDRRTTEGSGPLAG